MKIVKEDETYRELLFKSRKLLLSQIKKKRKVKRLS